MPYSCINRERERENLVNIKNNNDDVPGRKHNKQHTQTKPKMDTFKDEIY